MVEKVHGTVYPKQALTGGLNYFTVRTTLDIRPSASRDPQDPAQKRLNKLVEIISMRAQPIINGDVRVSSEAAPVADLPVTGSMSGSVTVYTFNFAIEHNLAWDANALVESLNGIEGFVNTTPTTANNVSITMHAQL
jgi:hypothetical protein